MKGMLNLSRQIAFLFCLPVMASAAPVSWLSAQRLGKCVDNDTAALALDCWLANQQFTNLWLFYNDTSGIVSWPNWPITSKQKLYDDFDLMVRWYHDGAPFVGTGGAASAPTLFPLKIPVYGPDPIYGYYMTADSFADLYIGTAAASLAAELTAQFPWSIATYSLSQLDDLFDQEFQWQYVTPPQVQTAGFYAFGSTFVSPSNPPFMVHSLKSNNMIASDAATTIARLVAWERNLRHMGYVTDPNNPNPSEQQIAEWDWGEESGRR